MVKAKKVLIIEDSGFMRLQVKNILEKEDFVVMELSNAEDYFSATWQYKNIGLIILDLNLPGMDGVAVLERMNNQKNLRWPPIIVLSGSNDKNIIKTVLSLGAQYYVLKPLEEETFLQKVQYLFDNPPPQKFEQKYFELTEVVRKSVEEYIEDDCKNIPKDRVDQLLAECTALVDSDEMLILFNEREGNVEGYSFRHAINVAMLSGIIGKWVGLKGKGIRELILAGLLHDLGKVKVPRDLLLKAETITLEEKKILNTHVVHSYDLINNEGFSKEVLLGVLQHHERMDGSGYPQGLLGKEISMTARIIAVADIYDAMISNKAYSTAETPFMVIEEVFREMFNELDPHICTVFLKNIKERLVGQVVCLADGSHAQVVDIAEGGFATPTLETKDGKLLDSAMNASIIGFRSIKS